MTEIEREVYDDESGEYLDTILITVEYYYSPGSRSWDPESPPEHEEFEITSATDEGGHEVVLTPHEEALVYEQAVDRHAAYCWELRHGSPYDRDDDR